METKPLSARGMSDFTWRHLVRTYGEEYAEICVLPDAEYWRIVAERMQTQNTERDLINDIVPSEWAPTLAAARRLAAGADTGEDSWFWLRLHHLACTSVTPPSVAAQIPKSCLPATIALCSHPPC